MNNPYIRFSMILALTLLIGIGVGYSVKNSSAAESVQKASLTERSSVSQELNAAAKQSSYTPQDDLANSRRNAITRAVERISPAVVGINVIEVRTVRDPISPFFNDPFFRQFFGDRTYKQEVKGLGSGFIISPDGYIVTNDHVAGNATSVTITLPGGKQHRAEVIGSDGLTDVCLLKIDGKDLPYVSLGNSDDIVIGEWSIAFGNPFGLFEINDKPTVTVGVISSVGMNLGNLNNRFYRDMIETDAAINGGNSGGPLVNSNGEVIGMNTLIYTGGQSSTYVGYGFAIPINKVSKIVAELKRKGKVTRDVATGFDAQTVDGRIARYFRLTKAEGIIVSEIEENGPAERAGLKVGDIIIQANGEKVNSDQDFLSVLVDANPGDTMKLKVYREGKYVEINLKLGKSS
jgi:serine protease Do